MADPPKLTDAELDAKIQASIDRILARVEANRQQRKRPVTDRTERIIPEPKDAD